jgi:hypothetical protein
MEVKTVKEAGNKNGDHSLCASFMQRTVQGKCKIANTGQKCGYAKDLQISRYVTEQKTAV